MSSSILTAFLGALQASISILITIVYGVIGAQLDLMSGPAAKKVSTICVKMFLPALLFANIGSQLDNESWHRYLPIVVWAIIYNCMSLVMGLAATRLFKLPSWVTPAITFQNSCAMPLLLIQSLEASGILATVMTSTDTSQLALQRAKSYFLVNSVIADSFTFGIGPRLLGAHDEDAPDADSKREEPYGSNSDGREELGSNEGASAEASRQRDLAEQEEEVRANEEDTLLPKAYIRKQTRLQHRLSRRGNDIFAKLPHSVQSTLSFMGELTTGPLICGLLGAIVGLVPPLHRAFFAPGDEGGVLNAWLTVSIRNIGELFPSLQIIVVGVKLRQSLKAMKKGEQSGNVPWGSMIFITFTRFILWPAISIPVIWALAKHTGVLSTDPILWFAMMLMPVGPSALKLTALAEVSGIDEYEQMSIAKFLTITYTVSPLICFGTVGALKASQAAVGS